jgi:hypothetical protein
MKILGRLIKRRLEYINTGRQCGFTKGKIIYRLYLYVEANPE